MEKALDSPEQPMVFRKCGANNTPRLQAVGQPGELPGNGDLRWCRSVDLGATDAGS
jgi:hypothetical protein